MGIIAGMAATEIVDIGLRTTLLPIILPLSGGFRQACCSYRLHSDNPAPGKNLRNIDLYKHMRGIHAISWRAIIHIGVQL